MLIGGFAWNLGYLVPSPVNQNICTKPKTGQHIPDFIDHQNSLPSVAIHTPPHPAFSDSFMSTSIVDDLRPSNKRNNVCEWEHLFDRIESSCTILHAF